MNRICSALFTAFLLLCLSPALAFAQAGSTAQISGTVKDQSGGVLPGVDVTVTQTATSFTRNAVSDADGGYVIPNLPVGPYRLEANLAGFRSYVQTGIVLTVNATPAINVVMALGEVSEQISVSANAAMVETRSTGVGQLIENQRVLELPLNGRQVTDLLLLSPGVTVNTAGGFASSRNYPTVPISVAGGSPGSTVYVMDGASHNDPGTNFNLPVPFPDALQEFRIETSALQARYGHHASAIVNVVTKSGTNELHGSAFEFVRDGRFNAKNAFALSKDSLRRNQFGGAAGGPIAKNKLFFFGGYQRTVIHTDPSTLQAFVPTADMLRGDFTALASPACNSGRQIALRAPFVNNQVSAAQLDPVALKYLQYIPVASDPCGRYQYGYPTPSTDNQFVGRVDYQKSARHSLYGRYMDIRYKLPNYFDGKNALTTPSVGVDNRGRSMVFGDTFSVSNSVINSFRATAIRSINFRTPSKFVSPVEVGAKVFTTPLAGAFTVADDLNLAWHRLDTWPDTVPGFVRLKRKFILAPCSNGNIALMVDIARRNNIPWDAILGSEIARDFKPKPAVYLMTAAALNLQPNEVMMVAAHTDDLRQAASNGLRTAHVARPGENGPGTGESTPRVPVDFAAKNMEDLAGQLGV